MSEKRYKATLEAIGSGLRKSKDIANATGLIPSTVNHYIAKAKTAGYLTVNENHDRSKGHEYELTQMGKDFLGRKNHSSAKVMQALDQYVMAAFHYTRRPKTLTAIHDSFMRNSFQ